MQRHYQGVDTRWTHRGELLVPVTFTTGLNYENMSEDRRGYENFVMRNGVPDYGVKGDKRRDERNLMWNVDPYLQTSWKPRRNSLSTRVSATVRSGLIPTTTTLRRATAMTAVTRATTSGSSGGRREVCGDGCVEPLRCRRAWL